MRRQARDLRIGNVIRARTRVGMVTSVDVKPDAVFAVVKDDADRWVASWDPEEWVEFDLIAA